MEGRALPMVFSPSTCPLPLVFEPRTTGFVGDWWRTTDYLLLFNSDAGSGCRDKPRSLDWLPTVADAEEKTLVPLTSQIPRLFERNISDAIGSKRNGVCQTRPNRCAS